MENSPHTPDTPEDEIHLLDYLIVLAKHSRMIILVPMAVTILIFLMLFTSPNRYIATARLLPPQQNLTMSGQLMDFVGGGIRPGNLMGGGLAGLFGLKSPADIFIGMLEGETIANRIIEQFDLKKLYKKKTLVDTRKALTKWVKFTAGKKDNLINIEVTDESATRAADMANAYITELDKLLKGLGVQEASGRLAFLEKELYAANIKLTKAEEALRSFSEKNSVIQIDTQTRGMLQYIAQLRADIDSKEVHVQVLRQQATPYNYDVVRLETEVKGLKDKLHTAEKQWDQTCTGDVCLTTSKMPMLGLEYIRLYREVKYQESLYQLYTKMVEMARMDLVKNVTAVQIVDQALPPDRRSNKRTMPALLGGIVAFLFMVFFVFFFESWRNFQDKADDAQSLTLIKIYLHPWAEAFHNYIPGWKRFFGPKL